jgi:GntR family transcriptional regulator
LQPERDCIVAGPTAIIYAYDLENEDVVMTRLDRHDPLPLYLQTKQRVLDLIVIDGLSPGDRLPTEATLESDLGVSRTTIRQALAELVHEGQVTRIQGKGTFVAHPRISGGPALSSFTKTVSRQGYTPSRRVLHAQINLGGPSDVVEKLELSDEPVVHIQRVLFADEDAVGLADTWLPFNRLREAHRLLDLKLLTERSLYDIIQSPPFSLVLGHATEAILPTVADEALAEVLDIESGEPILDVERVTRDPSGLCVELTRISFVGRRFVYRVDLYIDGSLDVPPLHMAGPTH